MNAYVKTFLHRGAIFGGFGPIVAGVVFLILSHISTDLSFGGGEMFLAIVSTYLLAFVHAGASVFQQIEHWSLGRSLLCHFVVLYASYSVCYVANAWIPFEPFAFFVFTCIFVAIYAVIWGIVFLSVRATEKKLNKKLQKR